MDQQNPGKAYMESMMQSLEYFLNDDELLEAEKRRKDFLDYDNINDGKQEALQKLKECIFKKDRNLLWLIPLVVRYIAAAAIIFLLV